MDWIWTAKRRKKKLNKKKRICKKEKNVLKIMKTKIFRIIKKNKIIWEININ